MKNLMLIICLTTLDNAATIIAAKDENTTGKDDQLARLLRSAAAGIRDYLSTPQG